MLVVKAVEGDTVGDSTVLVVEEEDVMISGITHSKNGRASLETSELRL